MDKSHAAMKIKRFEFNMFPVNCYVISDETGEAAVIDAGCYYPEEQQRLKRYIQDNHLSVKLLLNTHLHLDHIFGNAFMVREFGVRPQACKDDEFLLPHTAEHCRMFGFTINEEPAALGGYISDKDELCFGNTVLEAIHVPGHSPGGMVFYCKGSACMFSGDVLFQGSIGRSDLEGGNFNALRRGIIERLFVLPNETIVYPGHGDATSIGNEKMNNPFFR